MTTPTVEKVTPVPVHVTNPPQSTGKIYRSVCWTLTLTAANDAEELLPQSDNREIAWVQPLDDNVVINENGSDAARGNGTIIPKANNAPYPVQTSGTLYVAAPTLAGATSRVTVSAVYTEPDTVRNMDEPGPG
jgi:hypothetical protein